MHMSGTENLCKWHFDIQTGEDQGPGDALGRNFKGEPSFCRICKTDSIEYTIFNPFISHYKC